MKYWISAIMVMSLLGCAGAPVAGGLKNNKLADCSSKPNCVCSDMASDADHYIEPLNIAGQQDWDWLVNWLAARDDTQIISQTDDYLHITFTTKLMRYVDDVELHLRLADNQIAVRSASRVGYSDLGANAKRVEMIRQALQQK